MRMEWWILLAVWLLNLGMLLTIPKQKIRIALVSFLFIQALTWFAGLAVVEAGLISYPVRLFREENRSSFTFEFFVYPVVSAVFNTHYPYAHSKWIRFLYYCAYCIAMTIPEFFLVKYTDLIIYHHWAWYTTFITLFIAFAITRWFFTWFFKGIEQENE